MKKKLHCLPTKTICNHANSKIFGFFSLKTKYKDNTWQNDAITHKKV